MKKFTKLPLLLAGILLSALAFTSPALAVEDTPIQPRTPIEPRTVIEDKPVTTSDNKPVAKSIQPTFASEMLGDDAAQLRFGSNLVYLGNNVNTDATTSGLFFGFGNNLLLKNDSRYGFIAGNIINFSGKTERDLFIAGNMVTISKESSVGGDIYGTGNTFTIEGAYPGDISIAAASVSLNNATISGNLNLSAEQVIFSGDVQISGTLTVNEDAEIAGLTDHVTYAEISRYTVEEPEVNTTGLMWMGFAISVISLGVAICLIAWFVRGLHDKVSHASEPKYLPSILLSGLGIIFLLPLLGILLLLSVFAAPIGLVLIALFFILTYLSGAFSGAWLGNLIVERLFKGRAPIILEALIGIVILQALSLVPYLGSVVSVFSTLLGVGLVVFMARADHSDRPLKVKATTPAGQALGGGTPAVPLNTSAQKPQKSDKSEKPQKSDKSEKSASHKSGKSAKKSKK